MKKKCPMNRKPCMEEQCVLYQEFYDQDLVTGKRERLHRCAFLLTNDLLVQLASKQNETGAAVESFRNEMVKLSVNPLLGASKQLFDAEADAGGRSRTPPLCL